jgi:hypothetical protein
MKKRILALIALSLFTGVMYADQTGDCTAGEEHCEQNSLETTNTTTTNNTNVNTNTNNNTNVNTNTNNNTNVNTNTNNNTNANTTTTTSTNTSSNSNTNNNSNTNVNTSTSNATSTSNNTNNNINTNINTSTNTTTSNVTSNVNQNVNNTSTTSNTNTNVNTSNNTSNSTNTNSNTNINQSTSDSNVKTDNTNTNSNTNNNNTVSDNTNRNINENNSTQTIKQEITSKAPPASAIAPSIMSYSQDLCTTGRSGAFQGQVFGFSTGRTIRDENCEKLKLSKYLYDTGMKVAAVSVLCLDPRVFKSMEMAGTPCPWMGKVGKEASLAWKNNRTDRPDYDEKRALFIKKCRDTKHVAGHLDGLRKSKFSCKKEWNDAG